MQMYYIEKLEQFQNYPGAICKIGNLKIKIWKCNVIEEMEKYINMKPGSLINDNDTLKIKCKKYNRNN